LVTITETGHQAYVATVPFGLENEEDFLEISWREPDFNGHRAYGITFTR
jgi:hypothetical protein